MEYKKGFKNVEPQEFSRLMREPHILIDEVAEFVETLREQSTGKAVLVYCSTGGRSATACDMLRR